jgi:hypothetical protein
MRGRLVRERLAHPVNEPATCLVAALRRFQTLTEAIEASDCLGERQRGALGIGVVRRFAPGGDRNDALVGLAGLLKATSVQPDTQAAAVDLAGSQVNELERALWDSGLGG